MGGFTDERRWGMSPISPGVRIKKWTVKTIATIKIVPFDKFSKIN